MLDGVLVGAQDVLNLLGAVSPVGLIENYVDGFYTLHAEAAFIAMLGILELKHLGAPLGGFVVADFAAGPGCITYGIAAACAYVLRYPSAVHFPG